MAKINEKRDRIDLYIFGFLQKAEISSSERRRLPCLRVLMRTGEFNVQPQIVRAIGINPESHLRATVSRRVDEIPPEGTLTKAIFMDMIIEALHPCSPNVAGNYALAPFASEYGEGNYSGKGRRVLGAILVPLEELFGIRFAFSDGFGLLADRKLMERVSACNIYRRREQSDFAKKFEAAKGCAIHTRGRDLWQVSLRFDKNSRGIYPEFCHTLMCDERSTRFLLRAFEKFEAHLRVQVENVIRESNRHSYA